MSDSRQGRSGRSGQRRQTGNSASRGTTTANRFPASPYAELPELPLHMNKGDVDVVHTLIDDVWGQSPAAAIALTHFIAAHSGKFCGYAMQRRTRFLECCWPSPAATASAIQYLRAASQMDGIEAEATARLDMAELKVLRYFFGQNISWQAVIDSLQIVAMEFAQLAEDGAKREGSARIMLATILLEQSRTKKGTEQTTLYERAVIQMQLAIALLGAGYAVPGISELLPANTGSHADGQRSVPATS